MAFANILPTPQDVWLADVNTNVPPDGADFPKYTNWQTTRTTANVQDMTM
jgi:hypothetical protein